MKLVSTYYVEYQLKNGNKVMRDYCDSSFDASERKKLIEAQYGDKLLFCNQCGSAAYKSDKENPSNEESVGIFGWIVIGIILYFYFK